MSRQRHDDARLPGYEGPFFSCSDELREQLDRGGCPAAFLERAARKAGLVAMTDSVTTSDGYSWFRALRFRVGGGTVVVLIPVSQDATRRAGTTADRAIAAYTAGVKPRQAAAVMRALTKSVRKLRDTTSPRSASSGRLWPVPAVPSPLQPPLRQCGRLTGVFNNL